MKRFTRAYLTIALLLILLINAAVIVLYSHQFFFQATEDTGCLTTSLPGNCPVNNDPGISMIMINIGFFIVLFFVYFAVRHVYLSQRQHDDGLLDR